MRIVAVTPKRGLLRVCTEPGLADTVAEKRDAEAGQQRSLREPLGKSSCCFEEIHGRGRSMLMAFRCSAGSTFILRSPSMGRSLVEILIRNFPPERTLTIVIRN